MNRKSKIGILLGVLFALAMFVGLPYFLFSTLKEHSRSAGQFDAVTYVQNGRTVFATVVNDFNANTVSSGGGATHVSGTSKLYARAIDIESGEQLWNVRLKAKNTYGNDWGDAVLLGQSDKYLFFLRNELYVISKENGNVVMRNDDMKSIQDKLLKESSYFPSGINNYFYDTALQSVIIRGADGLPYLLDGNTLQISSSQDAKLIKDFQKKQQEVLYTMTGTNEELLVTCTRDNKPLYAFMDDDDYQILQNKGRVPLGHKEAPRRSLYTAVSDTAISTLKKVNNQIYIYGGFLKAFPEDNTIDRSYGDYFSSGLALLISRGNGRVLKPFHLPGGGYIILHRASIAQQAPVLITAISPEGAELWHINTNTAFIARIMRYQDHLLLLMMQENRSSEVSDIMNISLTDGTAKTYNFKERKFI